MASDAGAWQLSLRALLLAATVVTREAFAQECAYAGGWALRNDRSCPPTAPVVCGTGAQPRCCPSGFKCTGDGDYVGNYCCSDPSDCRQLALEHPQCPDPTWSLWGVGGKLDNGGWCCQSGQNGTYRDDSKGIALLCTPSTATSLPQNQFWGEEIRTASCSETSTTTTAASTTATATGAGADATNAASTASSSPAESTVATQPETAESGSISTGAIAGAAVGGVAGGALLAAAIFFLWRRKRRQSAAGSPESTATTVATGGGEGGSPGWAYGEQNAKFGHRYSELAVPGPRLEMESTARPTYELDASGNASH
ncbi:hypothetical protein CTA2_840 [Colletotrichum tanaceti]|uniref:Uncharacterized protein n=1 Tax=Colletotrichum tanaceti TaxID=1306861 RepID=A0A4U6XGA9_9PEZI|nr:hypothetical protein CTA2_840 [Colletotrichum tanaceti]TKW54409.1 hypothetical protein CTA1_12858 [Colletotrichum tanaceti]